MTNQQTTPEPTVEARRQEIVRLMNRTLIRDCLAIGAIIDEMLRDKDAAIEALRAELAEVRKLSPDADKALTEYALYLLNERPECAKAVDEAIQHIQGMSVTDLRTALMDRRQAALIILREVSTTLHSRHSTQAAGEAMT